MPPLTESQRENLHLMLDRDGIQDSIKYWWNPDAKRYEIIDGHNRYAWAASKRKGDFPQKEIKFAKFPNIAAVKKWMKVNQEGRRGGGTIEKAIEVAILDAEMKGEPTQTKTELVKRVTEETGKSRQKVNEKVNKILSDKPKLERKPKLSLTTLKRLIEALRTKVDGDTRELLDEILAQM